MERAAGFWRRFGAALIDGLLLGVLIRGIDAVTGWHTSPDTIWLSGGDGVYLVLSAAYFTYLHGLHGQTAGDAAMSIRVVDFDTGEVIGLQRAFIRWLMSIVSAIAIAIGYLWMLWDPQRQTWHDKVARTLPVLQATRSAQSP